MRLGWVSRRHAQLGYLQEAGKSRGFYSRRAAYRERRAEDELAEVICLVRAVCARLAEVECSNGRYERGEIRSAQYLRTTNRVERLSRSIGQPGFVKP
jgi:hypothetical protein